MLFIKACPMFVRPKLLGIKWQFRKQFTINLKTIDTIFSQYDVLTESFGKKSCINIHYYCNDWL